jgi:Gas vesicle protein
MTELESVSLAQSSLPQASQISLVDLLDRLLGTGVVLAGDVLISLAGVDLVQVRLHALITTVRADMPVPRNMRGEVDG